MLAGSVPGDGNHWGLKRVGFSLKLDWCEFVRAPVAVEEQRYSVSPETSI